MALQSLVFPMEIVMLVGSWLLVNPMIDRSWEIAAFPKSRQGPHQREPQVWNYGPGKLL